MRCILLLIVLFPFLAFSQANITGNANIVGGKINEDPFAYEKSIGAVFIIDANRGIWLGGGSTTNIIRAINQTDSGLDLTAGIVTNQPVLTLYGTNLLGQPLRCINTAGNANVHLELFANSTVSNWFSGQGKKYTIFTIVNSQAIGTLSSVGLSWTSATNSDASCFTLRPQSTLNNQTVSWGADTNQDLIASSGASSSIPTNQWFFNTGVNTGSGLTAYGNLTRGSTTVIPSTSEQTINTISFGNKIRGTGTTYAEHANVFLNTVIGFTNAMAFNTNTFIGGVTIPSVTNFHKYYNQKVPLFIVP